MVMWRRILTDHKGMILDDIGREVGIHLAPPAAHALAAQLAA